MLGKRAPRYDERTLKLARYLDAAALPAPPDVTTRAADHSPAFEMYGNDRIGDCTCAGMGNAEALWAALTARTPTVTDADVIAAYAAITGYDPATGANDNGAVELDVLTYWRNTGIGGHRIDAFTAVNLGDEVLTRTAVWLFDGLYIGLALPATAQGEQPVWDYTPAAGSQANPGSWGGHCVYLVDYNATGPVYVTWGRLQQATWAFHHAYCDEQYAVISADAIAASGLTAEGLDLPALSRDLAAIG